MAKRKLSIWQRRIFLVLVTAIGSLLIGLNLPGHPPAKQVIVVQPVLQVSPPTPPERNIALNYSVPKEFQGKNVAQTPLLPQEKVIALTFDDGPWPHTTEQVLDILKQYDIKATFFWIGKNVKNFPEIAKLVVNAGHVVGNHTWHHWYRHMNPTAAAQEVESTAEIIYQTTGVRTSLFRPPGGILNNGPAAYAKKEKYAVMMWSADSIDYRHISASRLINNVLKQAKSGGIVLMHDGGGNRSQTVKALPKIIDGLTKRGYKFVSVPELLDLKDKELKLATPSSIAGTTGQKPQKQPQKRLAS